MHGPRWGWGARVPTRGRKGSPPCTLPLCLILHNLGLNKALSFNPDELLGPPSIRLSQVRRPGLPSHSSSSRVGRWSTNQCGLRKHLRTYLSQPPPSSLQVTWRSSDSHLEQTVGQTQRLRANEDPPLSRQASGAAISLPIPPPEPPSPLFSKSKRGLNKRRVNRHRAGGGSIALCPRPTAQSKTKGPEHARGR